MNEQTAERRGPKTALIVLAALTAAGGAGVGVSQADLRRERKAHAGTRADLDKERKARTRAEEMADEASRRAADQQEEIAALRTEGKTQHQLIGSQEKKIQKQKQEIGGLRALRAELEEKLVAMTEKAERETDRADAADLRSAELERRLAETERQRQEEADRNLGDAERAIAQLEESIPIHAALEGDERAELLAYDCSRLRRIEYDLNGAGGEGADAARRRRTALAERYAGTCEAVLAAPAEELK